MDGYDEVNGRGWEMVPASEAGPTTTTFFSDELSVFPPRLHEGLTPTLTVTLHPPSDAFEEHKHEEKEEEEEKVVAYVTSTGISKSARRLVDLGINLIRSKLSNVGGGGGATVWSLAVVAGLAGALMYSRRRHRRERELLLLLLIQKDERIDQLMNQIVKMCEIVAANHKVPVLKNA